MISVERLWVVAGFESQPWGFKCQSVFWPGSSLGTWVQVPIWGVWFQLWCIGLVAPWHVGSSRTRNHVLCIGRWILNHCATRKVCYANLDLTYLPNSRLREDWTKKKNTNQKYWPLKLGNFMPLMLSYSIIEERFAKEVIIIKGIFEKPTPYLVVKD